MIGYRFQSGLSLIELISAIVVAAILIAVAAPGIQSTLTRSAVQNEAVRVLADVHYARSEAIKRHEGVNLCRSADAGDGCIGADCACLNGVAQRQWDKGWLIYSSSGSDTSFNNDTDALLRTANASPEQITIRANWAFNRWISVAGSGELDEADDGKLAVCMNGESTEDVPGMLVEFNLAGRGKLSKIPVGGDCDFPPAS